MKVNKKVFQFCCECAILFCRYFWIPDPAMNILSAQPAMSERVALQIRKAILAGNLAPSSRIRQEVIAKRLGVSRQPIRHALLVLEREGLVRILPNKGAIVSPLDRRLIMEIYEFREAVEAHVAEKVALRTNFDPAPLLKIIRQARAAIQIRNLEKLISLDLAFHNHLYLAAGNRVISEVMRAQWDHIRRAMLATLTVASYRKKAWDEHSAIVDAITRRQSTRARQLAIRHLASARTLFEADLSESI
jgi:DNA-binding GntR family transcriptional regulator